MTTSQTAHGGVSPMVSRLRASGPSELLQAVPYLIGFHPERSVVLLGLLPPRGQLAVSARLDLDAPVAMATPWFEAAAREGVDRFVLAIYDDTIERKPLPHTDLVEALQAMGGAAGMRFVDALAVNATRWWSYRCTDDACCADAGEPLTETGAVAATAVSLGLVAQRSRASLVAELAPDTRRALAVSQVWDSMTDQQVQSASCLGASKSRRKLVTAIKQLDWLLARYCKTQQPCDERQAANALLGLTNVTVRDAMISAVPLEDDALPMMFWSDLCRAAPDPLAAPPATMYALCAYARGEGARANIGLERALTASPDYRMAVLLDTAIASGMPPQWLIPDLVSS
ncbi:MAG: DUF4192 domain-containing protein, partial [Candidatus Nanopelagicales bacterium]